jgi:hypothetical protein
MVKFIFTPSAKAFGTTEVLRTIDVEMVVTANDDGATGIAASINGKIMHGSVVAHAAAFGLKQMLANSYASAGTAKNKDGGLLPASERLALWQGSFDKVLAKLIDPATRKNWVDVFTEGSSSEPRDPVEAEVARIVRATLQAWATSKGKKLPKADSEEYSALRDKLLSKSGESIRARAESIVAERNAIGDIDLDDDESDDEPAE